LGRVIIVSGTPGTGKTALASALAKVIGADYVNLTQYVSRHKLYSGIDGQRGTKIIDMVRTRTRLKTELGAMSALVLDTHIPDEIVPKAMVKRVLVLRCHPRVLEDRLRAKKWRADKIRENVLAEIVDSCLNDAVKHYGWRKVIQFDTSSVNMQGCIALAKRSIMGRPVKRIKIDWLTELEKEGLLDRYLK
jgi:adenylate kinase